MNCSDWHAVIALIHVMWVISSVLLPIHHIFTSRSFYPSVPVAPTQGYSKEKAKLSMKKPAQKWQWRQFDNPSRTVCVVG